MTTDNMKNKNINMNIDKSMFEFAHKDGVKIHDAKFDTKPVSAFRDAMKRFAKNKGSVVAASIILVLLLFAIFAPFISENAYTDSYAKGNDTTNLYYRFLLPKINGFENAGFFDGASKAEISASTYRKYNAMEQETGRAVIIKDYGTKEIDDILNSGTIHVVRVDSYAKLGMFNMTLTQAQYADLMKWQIDNNMQVIYPQVDKTKSLANDVNIWYECDLKGKPVYANMMTKELIPAYVTTSSSSVSSDYYYDSIRIAGDDGSYVYAMISGSGTKSNFTVRVDLYNYFIYKYGEEPSFIFGTTSEGYDIFSRLANGARFSFVLAIIVAAINMVIGAVIGAIEGYYGGIVDMTAERVKDIISGIPFIVVTVLFQMHMAQKVGVIGALIYAFILTGWVGNSSLVRTQFYRFKHQEYVMASRTLGANDFRLITKHIFPNSLGTIITSCAFDIPGVILSETSLSYLGIINLASSSMSSIGTMLSTGQAYLKDYPHVVLFPAIFIGLLMLSFNLFSNGLRDAFNPQLRGSEG